MPNGTLLRVQTYLDSVVMQKFKKFFASKGLNMRAHHDSSPQHISLRAYDLEGDGSLEIMAKFSLAVDYDLEFVGYQREVFNHKGMVNLIILIGDLNAAVPKVIQVWQHFDGEYPHQETVELLDVLDVDNDGHEELVFFNISP